MRRARKHGNVLTGEREKYRVPRGEVRKAARLAQSAQTRFRLAALFEEIRLPCEGAFDASGNNAYFAPQSATILRFATGGSQDQSIAGAGDFRAPRGSACRDPGSQVMKRGSEEGSRVPGLVAAGE